ncbi:hypothetical protein BT67DRAFT_296296 [Trichocladium antarcticum]|uniref:DUF6546 domain-containing protein n=1 Tax=Trichocladium antarcticum TaxID=1450529 RepID=A0AAN6UMK5_9PEZI|nr:hypothetical protein BT67DRAFT_296296 [Trichocladium antarcticum]
MEIDVLLSNAAVMARWMPGLQTLVPQIGHRGNACAFIYTNASRAEAYHRPFSSTSAFHTSLPDSMVIGTISGVIMITASAGFIGNRTAFFLCVVGALLCRQAIRLAYTKLAHSWRWVENGDTIATQCFGGIAAIMFVGMFAQGEVAAYGDLDIPGSSRP